MNDIHEKIHELRVAGNDLVLCTIVSAKGSTPRKVGAKMLVCRGGVILGTIGGGELERNVIQNALELFNGGNAKVMRHDLLHQHGMCCGGSVDIFMEPIMKKRKLYIFGAGHTGNALAGLSVGMEFETVLIDDRKEFLDQCANPQINKMFLPFGEALRVLPFDEQTYICIMTYSHPIDRNILAFCLRKPFAYLGMIGSRRKVEMTKKMFSQGLNISLDKLEEVDMPMGIDIGAEGPEEIALSIMSKLIAVKNNVSTWTRELQS